MNEGRSVSAVTPRLDRGAHASAWGGIASVGMDAAIKSRHDGVGGRMDAAIKSRHDGVGGRA